VHDFHFFTFLVEGRKGGRKNETKETGLHICGKLICQALIVLKPYTEEHYHLKG